MAGTGSTTVTKLKAWINHLKNKNNDKKEENIKINNEDVMGDEIEKHIDYIKQDEKNQHATKKKRRVLLEKHLEAIKIKRNKKKVFSSLSLVEKRIAKALVDWYEKEKTISDGILELHFKKNILVKTNFEKIIGEFDSTLKIKKMSGSHKLKEMLLIFRRGKNLLLDFYNRDLSENIYTFMFLNASIQSYQKSTEIANIINYFKLFFEIKIHHKK